MFIKKETPMLPKSEQTSYEKDIQKNKFLESIKVTPEELIENDKQHENRNHIKQNDDIDGPSLND